MNIFFIGYRLNLCHFHIFNIYIGFLRLEFLLIYIVKKRIYSCRNHNTGLVTLDYRTSRPSMLGCCQEAHYAHPVGPGLRKLKQAMDWVEFKKNGFPGNHPTPEKPKQDES